MLNVRSARPVLSLTSLRLRDFRCFPTLNCAMGGGITLFTGDNAQGKTSILEAVCVLLRLQSPRTSTGAELVRFGAPGFGIAGTLQGRELTHTVTGPDKKLLVDGQPQRRTADYLDASGLVVWMGNGDLELVSGTGEPRRRYLDFLGSQLFPEYRTTLKSYEKALRQRNFLLKRDASPPWPEIDAYTAVLVPHGQSLLGLRASLLEKLAPHAVYQQGDRRVQAEDRGRQAVECHAALLARPERLGTGDEVSATADSPEGHGHAEQHEHDRGEGERHGLEIQIPSHGHLRAFVEPFFMGLGRVARETHRDRGEHGNTNVLHLVVSYRD